MWNYLSLLFPKKAVKWEWNISADYIRSHHTPNHFNWNFQIIWPSLPLQFSLWDSHSPLPSEVLHRTYWRWSLSQNFKSTCSHYSLAMYIKNKQFSSQKSVDRKQSKKENFDRFIILYMLMRLIIVKITGLCELCMQIHHTASQEQQDSYYQKLNYSSSNGQTQTRNAVLPMLLCKSSIIIEDAVNTLKLSDRRNQFSAKGDCKQFDRLPSFHLWHFNLL